MKKKKKEIKKTKKYGFGKVICEVLLLCLFVAGGYATLIKYDVIELPSIITGDKDIDYVENVNIGVGEKFNVVTNDYNASKLSWRSLDEDVATVEDGVIKGVAIGETNVTVEDADGNKKTIYVYVNSNNMMDRSGNSSDDIFVIVYNPEGGQGSISSTSCKVGGSCAVSGSLFTREGYTFSGWISEKDSDGKQYNWTGWSGTWNFKNGQYGIKNNKLVLHAMWTKKSSSGDKTKIVYKANGGTGEMKSHSCTYGKSCTIKSNEFKKDGYEFDGWVTALSGQSYSWTNWKGTWYFKDGEYGIKDGKLVLYASWKKKDTQPPSKEAFTIKFNANGGSGSMKDLTCYKGELCTISKNTFKRDGYKWIKWRTTKSTSVAGYNWTGWSGVWNFKNGQYGINNNTLTLYATWEKGPSETESNKYTIKYMANGGSGKMENQTCTYGHTCTIKANKYTRSGYKFTKWRTSSSTSTAAYNWTGWSGTWYFTNGKYGIKDNTLVLYATWEKSESETAEKFTITYKPNGGSGSMAKQTCKSGKTCKIKNSDFSRQGYTFKGWTTNKDGKDDGYGWTGFNAVWNFKNGEKGIKDNKLVLYAIWTKKSDEKGWIKFDQDSYTCAVGQKVDIMIKTGGGSTPSSITSMSSTDTKIVTIETGTQDGLVTNCIDCRAAHITCKKAGTAKLKAKSSNGSSTTVSVKVTGKEVKVTKVTINEKKLKMIIGDTYKLTAKVSPDNATNKEVKWESSKPEIVSVDAGGNIKALKKGHVDIYAFPKDGSNVSGTVAIDVYDEKGGIAFETQTNAVVGCGGTNCIISQYNCTVGQKFTVKIAAYGGINKVATVKSYTSADKSIGTIEKDKNNVLKCANCLNTVITCKKKGTTTLTAMNSFGATTTVKLVVSKKK